MANAHFNKLRGGLTVLLLGATILPVAAQQPEPVVWVNPTSVNVNGTILAENCNGCGTAGAESQQQLTSGNGYVEFVPSTGHDVMSVGIGTGPRATRIEDMEFALRFTGSGIVEARENGNYLMDTRYTPGQRFRIAVEGRDVRYYTLDASGPRLLHTTAAPSTLQYPLKVEALLLGPRTQIEQVMVSRGGGGTSQQISWTNVVNATANGNDLSATGSQTNGGAQSNETLTGDGLVEFTAAEADRMRAIGLDNQNTDNTFQDIDFAIVLREAGQAEVWESGKYISDTPYSAGDRFRIAVEDGVVKYYKYVNGTLTPIPGSNATVTNYPLHVDAALYDPQSTISDVTGTRTN